MLLISRIPCNNLHASVTFSRFIRNSGWYPDRVLRLYPTQLTRYNDALVHEKVYVEPSMKVEKLAGDAIHYTYNDVHQNLVKSAGYAKAWADQRQANGTKASILKASFMLWAVLKMYLLKRGFRWKTGILIALLSAHSTFVKYADLWARDNDEHYKH